MVKQPLQPLSLTSVQFDGGFWGRRLDLNRRVTLRAIHRQMLRSGHLDAWRLDRKPEQFGHVRFWWDSDVAKWLEAVGYALAGGKDPSLRALADEVIDLLLQAQQPDGYLNLYFTLLEPGKRWTNLRDCHELYCAGHLMEAAVAWLEGTGDRRLLEALCRYADLIDSRFGRARGKVRGYPGHPEVELALVRLYRATGERRYLDLAKFFVDERGKRPNFFEREARARGERPAADHSYWQAHQPVRQQKTAEGHAVRALYLFCAMADLAVETQDPSLLAACRRLWRNVTERRMYVTGGVGSSERGERFTFDYDLPNETAYAETCAAVALVFWAHRMLQIERDGRYADVMERALYNGVLSGVSLDGRRFFYANPLAFHPRAVFNRSGLIAARRWEWFDCPCCPANLARLFASLQRYVASAAERVLYLHLYAEARITAELAGGTVGLQVRTDYPWDGRVEITVEVDRPRAFTLALRLPDWCQGPSLSLNGRRVDVDPSRGRGYAKVRRRWRSGDRLELHLPMPVRRVYAHPSVRADAGKVALQRGPLVYCLEEADNGPDLADLALPRAADLKARFEPDLLGGVVTLHGAAMRTSRAGWRGRLYRSSPGRSVRTRFAAVPYYAWANRRPGEMTVWIREV